MFGKERTNKMKTPRTTDLSPDRRELATKNEQPVHGEGSLVEHHEVSRRTFLSTHVREGKSEIRNQIASTKGDVMYQFIRVVLLAAGYMIGCLTLVSPTSAVANTHLVHPGDSIQAAVDAASPGDTIMVGAGTYRESVKIQTDGLTLGSKGSVTLKPLKYGDGQCYLPGHVAGFCVVPADFDPSVGSYTRRVRDVTITGFRIVGFDDGVFGFGTENLKVSHVVAINNTDYGVASFDGIGTRFTRNATSGSHDAGIYVGDSVDANAVVTNNLSWDNALGILIRHSHKVVLSHNKVWGNCLGVFLLSDIEAGGSGHITVQHNRVSANNNVCPNFEGFLPDLGGGGIVLAGSQHDIIFQNVVTDNRGNTLFSGGIVLITNTLPNPDQSFDVSKDNLVALNRLSGNEPADIVTDAASTPNVFVRNRCDTSIPDGLCTF
jgi:Periplasmic copper-binding protein (NosD)